MPLTLQSIKTNPLKQLTALLGIQKKIDYKALSNYILSINQVHDLQEILAEVSGCLNDMLDYRLFAFAVQEKNIVDLWVDPAIYSETMKDIVEGDFEATGGIKIHHIGKTENAESKPSGVTSSDLLVYDLKGEKYRAKLYVIPQRRLFSYHDEIMKTIINTIKAAVSNFMSIKKLKSAASVDPLTGCYNRREFEIQLESRLASAKRYGKKLSLVMFDIDHFKRVNDTYGHPFGDEVLKTVSGTVLSEIRKGDTLSRYGGEEFAVILPETDRKKSMELAERLRMAIEKQAFRVNGETVRVTASFGVSTFSSGVGKAQLVENADNMLYKAKKSGRNVVMPGLVKICPAVKRRVQEAVPANHC